MASGVIDRNNVRVSGRGTTPLVLAHGFGCDQSMWRHIVPEFEDQYQVITFDYVGAGGSDLGAYDAERYATLDGYASDLLEVIEALDLGEVIFVGHSVSSMIGVLAANRAPDRFGHLILIGPSPRYVNDPPDYEGGFERADLEGLIGLIAANDLGWASFLAPTVASNPDRPEIASELERSFCALDPDIAREFAQATFFADNRDDLPHVATPTLVLQCSEDAIAPEAVGTYVHEHISNSVYLKLDATGHCPHLSHPEETARAIRAYLDVA